MPNEDFGKLISHQLTNSSLLPQHDWGTIICKTYTIISDYWFNKSISGHVWLFLPMDVAWTASRLCWTNKWQDGVQPQNVVPGRCQWPSIHTLSTESAVYKYAYLYTLLTECCVTKSKVNKTKMASFKEETSKSHLAVIYTAIYRCVPDPVIDWHWWERCTTKPEVVNLKWRPTRVIRKRLHKIQVFR